MTNMSTCIWRWELPILRWQIATLLPNFFQTGGEMNWNQKVLASSAYIISFLILGWLCILADQLNEQVRFTNENFSLRKRNLW